MYHRRGCVPRDYCGSDHVRSDDRYLNQTGRNLLAYVYVKDKRGW